jgi:hypothetical protein
MPSQEEESELCKRAGILVATTTAMTNTSSAFSFAKKEDPTTKTPYKRITKRYNN